MHLNYLNTPLSSLLLTISLFGLVFPFVAAIPSPLDAELPPRGNPPFDNSPGRCLDYVDKRDPAGPVTSCHCFPPKKFPAPAGEFIKDSCRTFSQQSFGLSPYVETSRNVSGDLLVQLVYNKYFAADVCKAPIKVTQEECEAGLNKVVCGVESGGFGFGRCLKWTMDLDRQSNNPNYVPKPPGSDRAKRSALPDEPVIPSGIFGGSYTPHQHETYPSIPNSEPVEFCEIRRQPEEQELADIGKACENITGYTFGPGNLASHVPVQVSGTTFLVEFWQKKTGCSDPVKLNATQCADYFKTNFLCGHGQPPCISFVIDPDPLGREVLEKRESGDRSPIQLRVEDSTKSSLPRSLRRIRWGPRKTPLKICEAEHPLPSKDLDDISKACDYIVGYTFGPGKLASHVPIDVNGKTFLAEYVGDPKALACSGPRKLDPTQCANSFKGFILNCDGGGSPCMKFSIDPAPAKTRKRGEGKKNGQSLIEQRTGNIMIPSVYGGSNRRQKRAEDVARGEGTKLERKICPDVTSTEVKTCKCASQRPVGGRNDVLFRQAMQQACAKFFGSDRDPFTAERHKVRTDVMVSSMTDGNMEALVSVAQEVGSSKGACANPERMTEQLCVDSLMKTSVCSEDGPSMASGNCLWFMVSSSSNSAITAGSMRLPGRGA